MSDFVELEYIDGDYRYNDETHRFMVEKTINIYVNRNHIIAIEEKGIAVYEEKEYKYYMVKLTDNCFIRIFEKELIKILV